jgi:glutamyl-tRNA reductase
MPILLYGMNHVSAPVELRERIAVPADQLISTVERLVRADGIEEGLILSTCNRTEVLVNSPDENAPGRVRTFLQGERQIGEPELERHCYLHANQEAVRHVFRVASSLDSMVVGEPQILGQVKEAYAAASQAGALKGTLDSLMRRAFSVAKKVRTETGIARSPVSIAHAAADLARDIFGDLKRSTILVLGAGKMGRLAARHLVSSGAESFVVVNRSYQRAVDVARELGGRASPFDRLFEEIDRADIVIASTAAPQYVIRYEDGPRLRRGRRGRPIFFVDIALPRNIDPDINKIDNFYLYDIDELGTVVQKHMGERRKEAICAEAIVERETEAYLAWLRTLQVAPTIVELRKVLHDLGAEELHRFRGKLGTLTPQQQGMVEQYTTALINKLLHKPIHALKTAAAQKGGDSRVEFLRHMFGLGAVGIHADKADSERDAPPGSGESRRIEEAGTATPRDGSGASDHAAPEGRKDG